MSEIPAGAMRFNSDSQLEYWNGRYGFKFILQHQILQVLRRESVGVRGTL